jgi:hypothetical protein
MFKELRTNTGEGQFTVIDEELEKQNISFLDLNDIVTDACPSMVGTNLGVTTRGFQMIYFNGNLDDF